MVLGCGTAALGLQLCPGPGPRARGANLTWGTLGPLLAPWCTGTAFSMCCIFYVLHFPHCIFCVL